MIARFIDGRTGARRESIPSSVVRRRSVRNTHAVSLDRLAAHEPQLRLAA
jgi:hypothetical protein